jgi:hypothetical protein
VQTVTSLAKSRFDWAHALHEVARVLPENAWLTSLTGTVSPGTTVAGGGGGGLRGSLAVPAIEVTGCTTSQSSVAKMMARLRLIDGVHRVSLSSAEKGTGSAGPANAVSDSAAGATGSGGGSTSDCRNGHAKFPKFNMVVFYDPAAAPAAATASTASTAPATASSTTPAPAVTTPPATTGTTTTPAPAPSSATTTTPSAGTTPTTTTTAGATQ